MSVVLVHDVQAGRLQSDGRDGIEEVRSVVDARGQNRYRSCFVLKALVLLTPHYLTQGARERYGRRYRRRIQAVIQCPKLSLLPTPKNPESNSAVDYPV